MSSHIHRFIDLIKAAEARGHRDIYMPLRDARDLHNDITRLLITLEELRTPKTAENEVIEIEINGGNFNP